MAGVGIGGIADWIFQSANCLLNDIVKERAVGRNSHNTFCGMPDRFENRSYAFPSSCRCPFKCSSQKHIVVGHCEQ
jgi:hypothetical protein